MISKMTIELNLYHSLKDTFAIVLYYILLYAHVI